MFDAAETIARYPQLERGRVGIITNGGGAGILAVEKLVERGGELAELAPSTIERLSHVLPPTWSHANPVDIVGDAAPGARPVGSVPTQRARARRRWGSPANQSPPSRQAGPAFLAQPASPGKV
ncbi:hypothetical protein [Mesorhizobium sp. M1A.F.Ca.ET.072.01.1.1]|uniref:hypothetical protein n=1 Tax=Mesorhizobium sp. M1A.F.Ca.ET.072.01.1.1 TaxID=2496753 RepID=UPI0032AF3D03